MGVQCLRRDGVYIGQPHGGGPQCLLAALSARQFCIFYLFSQQNSWGKCRPEPRGQGTDRRVRQCARRGCRSTGSGTLFVAGHFTERPHRGGCCCVTHPPPPCGQRDSASSTGRGRWRTSPCWQGRVLDEVAMVVLMRLAIKSSVGGTGK